MRRPNKPAWELRARCRYNDDAPDFFSNTEEGIAAAKEFCHGCLVERQCLEQCVRDERHLDDRDLSPDEFLNQYAAAKRERRGGSANERPRKKALLGGCGVFGGRSAAERVADRRALLRKTA